jgi:hypothetical protein
VLNQPIIVHGDDDGSVRFVPLLISTPSLARPRVLFEIKVSHSQLERSWHLETV